MSDVGPGSGPESAFRVGTLSGDGEGRLPFLDHALMTDYDIFGRMMHDSLVDIASGLRGNFVNYTDTETTNINSLVSVNGDIPGANL